MTCREKLRLEYPSKIDSGYVGGCEGCPHDYGYLEPFDDHCPHGSSDKKCAACWDREIPGTPRSITPIPTETWVKLVTAANEMIQTMEQMTDAMRRLTTLTKEYCMKLEIEKGKLDNV